MNKAVTRKKQLECLGLLILIISMMIFRTRIGDIGVGIYFTCFILFEAMWFIFGDRFSDILGRILRNKYSRGKNKEAKLIWKYGLIIQVLSALICSGILFFIGTKLFQNNIDIPQSFIIVCIFCICLAIRMIAESIGGYLCGKGANTISGFASVLRSLGTFGLGLLFSAILDNYGNKVAALLKNEIIKSIYGLIALGIAMIISEIAALIYLLMFKLVVSRRGNDYEDDYYGKIDNTGNVFLMLWRRRIIEAIAYFLFVLPYIFIVFTGIKGINGDNQNIESFGLSVSCVIIPALIFVLFGYFMLLPLVAKTSAFLKKREMKYARLSFQAGFHLCFIYGVFGMAFLVSIGTVLAMLLAPSSADKLSSLILFGGFFCILILVCCFVLKLFLLEGQGVLSIILLSIANVICFILINALSTKVTDISRRMLICLIVFYIINTIGFILLSIFRLDMSIDPINNILVPILVGAVCGVIALLLSKLLAPHLGNIFTSIFCFILILFLYVVLLLLSRNFVENELEYLPGSKFLRALGQMFHVL